jgi:adenosylcobinamide kinase / adenosylcobinamide-phosphate guanylyltransferase
VGGSRSGKSGFAETLLESEPAVDYVATAAERPDDAEWTQRIHAHRERRPADWRTVETGDVTAVLATSGPAVLVDSITTWLAREMDAAGCWTGAERSGELAERVDALCWAWAVTPRFAVAVSDEVGLGVVPETPAGRRFRDELGLLNQRLAAAADAMHLVVAGIPLQLR